MNSLQQYLDLYRDHGGEIRANAPAPLNSWREDAWRALQGQRLPDTHTDGYEKTSIEELMRPDLGVNIRRLNFQADVAAAFKCDIPNMSTLMAVVVNDIFHPTRTLMINLPQGVEFTSMRELATRRPEILGRYYGSVAPLDNPSVALNTLMAQDGVVVYVPRGVKLPRPLQLVNLFSSGTPLAAFRRILVVAEEDAEVQLLLCDHTQSRDVQFISQQVVEVVAKHGAKVDIYDIEKSSAETSRHSMTFADLHGESSGVFNTTTLGCGVTRNEYAIGLNGERAEALLTGMAIVSRKERIDNSSTVRHNVPRCRSNQLFKYALDGDARGAFGGSIIVTPGAPFTEAYQSNRNLVASPTAKMHTRPTLLIYNDEVKCSHGATTGQIDEEALFYMRTRGIPEKEARNMLMQAFMTDVIGSVRPEALRDRLRHLVEKRFCAGDADGAACDSCGTKD